MECCREVRSGGEEGRLWEKGKAVALSANEFQHDAAWRRISPTFDAARI